MFVLLQELRFSKIKLTFIGRSGPNRSTFYYRGLLLHGYATPLTGAYV